MDTAGGGEIWTIVVAAGSGSRFGAPKQFLDLLGERVVDRSIRTAARHSDGVVVVTPAEPGPGVAPIEGPDGVRFRSVTGADSRAASVRHGLTAVPPDARVILVHDAARPLATDAIFERVIDAVRAGADAVTPVVTVADSLRRRGGGTVDRNEIVAVQTPQGFDAAALRSAHEEGGEASDDVTVVENNGGTVVLVDGDRRNLKLTTPFDLDLAVRFLERDSTRGRGHRVGGGRVSAEIPFRVGHAFDIHARSDDPDRRLVLGGLTFPGEPGLIGHSDADVIAHACVDALLGAAGLGDIGQMFPDTDPAYAGIDSLELLRMAAGAVREAGWQPGNVDCSVMLDTPKLAPRKAEMEAALSAAAGAPVTVSGRRTEGIGSLGRGDGIVAWAVALVAR